MTATPPSPKSSLNRNSLKMDCTEGILTLKISGACFRLRGLVFARTKPRKLKHAPQKPSLFMALMKDQLGNSGQQVASIQSSHSHIQKLVGWPLAGYAPVEIIAGEGAGPRAGSVLTASVQREYAHGAPRVRRLK